MSAFWPLTARRVFKLFDRFAAKAVSRILRSTDVQQQLAQHVCSKRALLCLCRLRRDESFDCNRT